MMKKLFVVDPKMRGKLIILLVKKDFLKIEMKNDLYAGLGYL